MKKNKNTNLQLLGKLLLSLIVLGLGAFATINKTFGLTNLNIYASVLFFVLAFFSIIIYFLKRKDEDYEVLLFALVCVMTGAYTFALNDKNPIMVLASGLSMFTLLIVLNRVYACSKIKNKESLLFALRSVVSFLIALIGTITLYNLYNQSTIFTLMLAYYFLNLGLLMLIENIVETFVNEDALKKIFTKDILPLEEIKEEKPKRKQLKKVEVKKIDKKKPVEKKITTRKKATTKKTQKK